MANLHPSTPLKSFMLGATLFFSVFIWTVASAAWVTTALVALKNNGADTATTWWRRSMLQTLAAVKANRPRLPNGGKCLYRSGLVIFWTFPLILLAALFVVFVTYARFKAP
jgi:hypothetical protein